VKKTFAQRALARQSKQHEDEIRFARSDLQSILLLLKRGTIFERGLAIDALRRDTSALTECTLPSAIALRNRLHVVGACLRQDMDYARTMSFATA
jgi:hypothetical protein